MITIQFDDGGTQRSLDILADSFSELRPVFGPFTKWMRGEVDQVFASGGDGQWPERSQEGQQRADAQKSARVEKIERNQYNSLRGALRSERRRAERRYSKSQTVAGELFGGRAETQLTKKRRQAVERYEALQAELERYVAGGAKSDDKRYKKLYERVGRREERAAKKIEAVQGGQLLGQVANSLSVKFDKSNWEMFSRITWAGVHNEGGVAGHGARIPARTFLEWTPARLEKFVEMANDYLIRKAEKAGAKQ